MTEGTEDDYEETGEYCLECRADGAINFKDLCTKHHPPVRFWSCDCGAPRDGFHAFSCSLYAKP